MGQLCLALSSLGRNCLLDPRAGWALAGIAVTFVMNLSVSFGLALRVALRARGANAGDRRAILVELLRRAVAGPGEFLFPPSAS
jgi:site-specific recombinase